LEPEAGAQCGNAARWDLRGGPPARAVPTATRYGNPTRKFVVIDAYVHERLAILASDKHGLKGRNWGRRFNGDWFRSLKVYRLTGTARWGTPHAWR
jgi:hypothetical protein